VERQQGRLQSASVYERTKHKAQGVRMGAVKQQLRSKTDFLRCCAGPLLLICYIIRASTHPPVLPPLATCDCCRGHTLL
jgi:hypothetical protein